MADQVSALRTHLVPGRFGAPGEAGVTLAEVEGFCLFQLAAWPETIPKTGAVAAKATGVSGAPGPGQVTTGKNGTLLRVEPLKWWVITESSNSVSQPTIAPEDGSFVDLSHARTWLRIGGEKANVLLNQFLPIDLRYEVMPAGAVASTAFHHIGVTLWRDDKGFNLLLPRSFAASLWELLYESALQYGLEVR